jgi:outer membrane lipopolysaccharide assembly protein LptE/RlpB
MSSSDRLRPGWRAVAALALAAGLAACGFRLRGDVSYAFDSLYVAGPPASPIVL